MPITDHSFAWPGTHLQLKGVPGRGVLPYLVGQLSKQRGAACGLLLWVLTYLQRHHFSASHGLDTHKPCHSSLAQLLIQYRFHST